MLVANALVLLLAVAGFTKILVETVNRLHALALPERWLKQLRHAHDLLLVAFPPTLVGLIGLSGPRLLRGGTWEDVPLFWQAVLAVCLGGAVALAFSTARWLLRRPPESLVSNHSQVVDVAERLGFRPVEAGPYRVLTRVPGNQIFELEVNEKTYELPRLPAEWDGLSILHLSDLHFIGTVGLPYFEQVMELARETEPDLIVLTGDVIDDLRLLEWIPPTLGTLSAPLGRYFILGNHDWRERPDAVRAAVRDVGWTDVAGRTVALEHLGHRLVIGGTERPWMGAHPEFDSSEENDFRLLLSHTPDNVGWARERQIDLMLSGHNHGGQVVLPVFGPVYSPSVHGCRYAAGAFLEPPTLLYVTRGLSGQHPLRLNCRPELTKLVLRAPADSSALAERGRN